MKASLALALVVTITVGVTPSALAAEGNPQGRKSLAQVDPALLAAREQARPNSSGNGSENPYKVPALVLLAGGGLVTLYGLTHETGIECNSTSQSLACGTTKSKAVIFAGLGMVGVGGFLWSKGKSHPDLVLGPRFVGVRKQFIW